LTDAGIVYARTEKLALQRGRFDEIGWVTDIRTALRLGKEYNRPIFLYTGDGRINTGRC
jgi:hypothetical protein